MKLQPNRNYKSNDAVMTPDALARQLVKAIQPKGRVLEPCAGGGAFVRAMRLCSVRDVVTCEIAEGSDFFAWHDHVDWIVTNPPWSQFARFLEHSLRVADHVAMLATVNHWWTKRRVRQVLGGGFGYRQLILVDWPAAFPQSGFQLGMMYVSRGWVGRMSIRDMRATSSKEQAEMVL